jgi:GH24 family phage-related lysozyme (muramidase)
MKPILILIFCLFPLISEPEIINNRQDNEKLFRQLRLDENLQKTIEFIKVHEGFSAYVYNDNGYQAIGYGQRLICYDKTIQEPVTKAQAERILFDSFSNHIRIIRFNFPELNDNQVISVAHLSYCKGIGYILKNELVKNNRLDVYKLRKLPHPSNREFEIMMFYNLD